MPRLYGAEPDLRWVDLNGNGTTDLVYADAVSQPRMQMVDIGEVFGCVPKPHLLKQIDNGIGRITDIEYRTSVNYALEDGPQPDGEYRYSWPNPLPFPVEVVSRVLTSDSLGNQYRTEISYHEGYYDAFEKQFRGFAYAEQTDIGDDTAPTLVTQSQFDTGAAVEAMKGKLLALETRQETGEVFSRETTDWAVRVLYDTDSTDGRRPIRYAHPTGTVTDILERDQGTPRRLETEVEFDNYGNQTVLREYGIVEDGDRSAFNDERITLTEYAYNLDDWLIGFPTRVELQDLSGQVISRSETYYDDPSYSGSNFGQVTLGNVTLVRNWTDPDQSDAYIDSVRTRYDSYGNPVALLDPLATGEDPNVGHYRELVYDPYFHTYPIEEILHVGDGKDTLSFNVEYDLGWGTLTRSRDTNNHVTDYRYDTFARPTAVIRPYDSEAYPTMQFSYALAQPFVGGLINYVETRALDKDPTTLSSEGLPDSAYLISRSYVDGLGRALMSKTEAEPDPDSGAARYAVSGAVQFNLRAGVAASLLPYFSSTFEHEDIEAPGWQGLFHENGQLLSLDLNTAHRSQVFYDALLREQRSILPDGSESYTEFEPLLARVFDENDADPSSPHYNTPTINHNDGLGRTIRMEQSAQLNDDGTPAATIQVWPTRYVYRADDVLLQLIDAQNNTKLIEYDGLGRKTFMNDLSRGHMIYTYDDASNLVETLDAKNQRITYEYDGLNRMLSEDYHDGANLTPDVSYHYDDPAPAINLGNGRSFTGQNTKGYLSWVSDLSGEEHNSFDNRGRVQAEVKQVIDPTTRELIPYHCRYAYDSLDRMTDLYYPDGDHITYTYNDRSLLQTISGNLLNGIAYTPSGQRLNAAFGNGVSTKYAYDNRARLNSLRTGHPGKPLEPLIAYDYQFDAISNVLSITDQRPTSKLPIGTDRTTRHNTQYFQYDDLYRLTQYRLSAPADPENPISQLDYRYDRTGNILYKSSPAAGQPGHIEHNEAGRTVVNLGAMTHGGASGAWNRTGRAPNEEPGPHAVTATEDGRFIDYDANGNITSLEDATLTWDFQDRLIGYTNQSVSAQYVYDYANQRRTKRVTSLEDATSAPTTTTYVSKTFEIREGEVPTKFAFDDQNRIARFTRILDTGTDKIQWLRMREGWNFICLYVEPGSATVDSLFDLGGKVIAIYQYDRLSDSYVSVTGVQTLASGEAYMLQVSESHTLTIRGPPIAIETIDLPTGANALTWPSPQPLKPKQALQGWELGVESFWTLSEGNNWQSYLPLHPANLTNTSDDILPPGQAAFLNLNQPVTVDVDKLIPDDIRFYHSDHLGSSSVVTDRNGALIEETAFYPYGHPRNQYTRDGTTPIADYRFTGKEQDIESRMTYFGARYYSGVLGTWASPDPAEQFPNLYLYAANNPLVFVDPDGLNIEFINGRFGASLRDLDWVGPVSVSPGPGNHRAHIIPFAAIQNDLITILNTDSQDKTQAIEALTDALFNNEGNMYTAMINARNNLLEAIQNQANGETIAEQAQALLKQLNSSPDNVRPGDANMNQSIGNHIDADLHGFNNGFIILEINSNAIVYNYYQASPNKQLLKFVQRGDDLLSSTGLFDDPPERGAPVYVYNPAAPDAMGMGITFSIENTGIKHRDP